MGTFGFRWKLLTVINYSSTGKRRCCANRKHQRMAHTHVFSSILHQVGGVGSEKALKGMRFWGGPGERGQENHSAARTLLTACRCWGNS